ncbi:hypothetical protein HC028_21140 [Planosporangium flavigriseum]|uniref:Rho termination factor N-terminal domain-containing protein n=1 Tax=Planosporangium flavigriseum TaxID=373681 RepID=A0A8J3LU95_9ACTN|nr:hypothetical protein [Planosporangium flavigriseum]NJC66990.1 hypothetical protein [Planosporangium flavigriseum]GIG73944.1 hypothetical protein Pfl04_23480 [Planosporangium flavigriseum]
MTAVTTLLIQVNQRIIDFLRQQPEDQLVAFAEGRLSLSFMDHASEGVTVSTVPRMPQPQELEAASSESQASPAPAPPTSRRRAAKKAATVKKVATAPSPRNTSATRSSPGPEPVQIAETLRGLETVEDGAAYLAKLKPTVALLQEIGAELGLKLSKLRKDELVRKVLEQAIGARRKFAGLRQW